MGRQFKICLHSFLVCSISFLPLGTVAGKGGGFVQHTAHQSQSSSLHSEITAKQGINTPFFSQQSAYECGIFHCDADCGCGNCSNAIINDSPLLHNKPDMPYVLILAVLIIDSSGFTPPFRPPRI